MRVVIVDDDLFAGGGGGQTFYRKLILDHPEISFTYFLRDEPADGARPPNARVIAVGGEPTPHVVQPLFTRPADFQALRRALAYATALSDTTVDIVDVPDYKLFGPFLRDALDARGVTVRAIVHSMHGVVSDSITRDWDGFGHDALDLRDLELRQFEDADGRYAISEQYADEWRKKTGMPVEVIDPACVLARGEIIPATTARALPELLCVGRRERRKGNDLALEITAWLDPAIHRGLRHIGAPSPAGGERSSDALLAEIARVRGLPWQAEGPRSQESLFSLYRENTALLAPVRYDTFNLTVLEAAAIGVPVAVSQVAGVNRYLATFKMPAPVLAIDADYPHAAATSMASWLSDYASLRGRSIEFAKLVQDRIGALDLRDIYSRSIDTASRVSSRKPTLEFQPDDAAIATMGRVAFSRAYGAIRKLGVRYRQSPWLRATYRALHRHSGLGGMPLPASVAELAGVLNGMPEGQEEEIDRKIAVASRFDSKLSGRCTVWSELARLERMRGGDLRAAAYDTRSIRLAGGDHFGRMPLVRDTLEAHGMSEVARSIELAYGSRVVPGEVSQFLAERRVRLREVSPLSKAVTEKVFDSRSNDSSPEISVLVSIYNAGPKLERFISQLGLQTAVKESRVELVLVDAASPADEFSRAHMAAVSGAFAGRIVYIRTSTRISIQAAWNVALQHARGKFITCLGVDETLYPEALTKLAGALHSNPDADWAMASSLVVDVTAVGGLVRDKMLYDRTGAARDMTMLDTTYLSWVGGLYRRSLHDRFGYYDPDFRAAGDTEFKNRILPYIKVAYITGTLGLFHDYPEDRASAGVRAEIEDSLAWYIFRTPPGAAALFERRSTAELESIVFLCASLRKCYRTEPSTDVEFAVAASAALAARADAPVFAAKLARLLTEMRNELRNYDMVERRGVPPQSMRSITARFEVHAAAFKNLTGQDCALLGLNDNRFEQHSWAWTKDS